MTATERQRHSARRDSVLGDQPGAFASARYVRITPLKARRVVELVRGLPVQDALDTLAFAPQAAAQTVYKVLESAVANARTTEGLDTGDLVVSRALVDEGPTMKRWRPRAQGRATRINKRTSHITLAVQPLAVVSPERAASAATKAAAKAGAKKTTTKKSAAKKSAPTGRASKTATKKSAAATTAPATTETKGEDA